jgi:hypothetical protein
MGLFRRFFLIAFIWYTLPFHAQDIEDDVASCSGVLAKISILGKKRNYEEALNIIKQWQAKYPNSDLHDYVDKQKIIIQGGVDFFQRIKDSEPAIFNDMAIPIGKFKGMINEISNDTVSYSVKIGQSTQRKTIEIGKLPAPALFFMMKKISPQTYLTDTIKLLILDNSLSYARKLLLRAKKGKRDISQLMSIYKDWSSFSKITREHQKIKAIWQILNKGDIPQAKSLMREVKISVKRQTAANRVFKSTLIALEKAIELKPLESYLNYPLKADQHKKVHCLEFPGIKYDIYLPPQYDHSGKTVFPILYTFSPGGGGMVRNFKAMAKKMGIIVIGNLESKNGRKFSEIKGSWYALMRDLQRRVHFDPSRQFAGGFSGGGLISYIFFRNYSHHISGIVSMGGWLGFGYDRRRHWYRENVFVARTTGVKDTGAGQYLGRDKRHLEKFKVVVKDWEFAGGHSPASGKIQVEVFEWLLKNRPAAEISDKDKAVQFYEKSKQKMAAGKSKEVMLECLKVFVEQPWTWQALKAQLIFDEIMLKAADKFSENLRLTKEITKSYILEDTFKFYHYSSPLAGKDPSFKSYEKFMQIAGWME